MAAEFSIKNLGLILFYSKNILRCHTGIIIRLLQTIMLKISIRQDFTLHHLSLTKKDAVTDLTYGINLSYNFNNLRFGLAWSEDRLSLPVRPSVNNPEKVFDFSGNRNTLYTIYYNSLIKRILLYGEFSTNES